MSTPNTALALSSPKDLLSYLNKSRSAIEMALPKHLNPDRMMRLALTCFSTSPALQRCRPQSILASVVVASQLGLEPGIAGQGYLIPYKDTCTFVPGWQGLVSLLNNTGRATAWTGAVYDGDDWVFELGSAPKCQHVPGPNYGDPEKLTWVYACGKVNGSEQPVVEAWPISRVWRHRDRHNKVGGKHYSYGNEEMYARKVVLLQVLKYMPRSIELNNAIAASNAAEQGMGSRVEGGVVVEVAPEATDIPQPTFKEPARQAAPSSDEAAEAEAGVAPAAAGEPKTAEAEKERYEKAMTARYLKAVRGLLKSAAFSDGHLVNLLHSTGQVEESLATLDDIATVAPEVIKRVHDEWAMTLDALKAVEAKRTT